MDINERVFFARVVPQCDIYEVLSLVIRTAKKDWFVGVDSNTRQAYPFNCSSLGTLIFSTSKEAEQVVKDAKKKYGTRKLTKVVDMEEET